MGGRGGSTRQTRPQSGGHVPPKATRPLRAPGVPGDAGSRSAVNEHAALRAFVTRPSPLWPWFPVAARSSSPKLGNLCSQFRRPGVQNRGVDRLCSSCRLVGGSPHLAGHLVAATVRGLWPHPPTPCRLCPPVRLPLRVCHEDTSLDSESTGTIQDDLIPRP